MQQYEYYEPQDSWWINEKIEEQIHKIKLLDSPYEHLHDWLEQANPEVFKQWQAVYDIEKE